MQKKLNFIEEISGWIVVAFLHKNAAISTAMVEK